MDLFYFICSDIYDEQSMTENNTHPETKPDRKEKVRDQVFAQYYTISTCTAFLL